MVKKLAPITPRIPGQATPLDLDRFVEGDDGPVPPQVAASTDHPVVEVTQILVDPKTEIPVDPSTHPSTAVPPRRSSSKAPKKGGRALFARADGSARRKVSFYFEPELAKQLHLHCVATDRDMSTFVADLVRRALARHV